MTQAQRRAGKDRQQRRHGGIGQQRECGNALPDTAADRQYRTATHQRGPDHLALKLAGVVAGFPAEFTAQAGADPRSGKHARDGPDTKGQRRARGCHEEERGFSDRRGKGMGAGYLGRKAMNSDPLRADPARHHCKADHRAPEHVPDGQGFPLMGKGRGKDDRADGDAGDPARDAGE